MKDKVAKALHFLPISSQEIENIIEIPPNKDLGDFALPCFTLAKSMKKSPVDIAKEISSKVKSKDFEKVVATGPYVNFFLDRRAASDEIISSIMKEKSKYGSSSQGKGKTIAIDLSAPNIAKPFGIGHLRSTIIGDSLARIASHLGYKTIKINYLGDWGTQFGKLIVGYKKFGSDKKLKDNPISHLQELYVKVSSMPELEDEARQEFLKLEQGDKKNLALWKKFRAMSLKEFDNIYNLLGVEFDVISGESLYNSKMDAVVDMLERKGLLEESEGAQVVNLEKYGLGVCLIKKSDGATLYATRDIAAAIDRHEKYKFDNMIYEVGAEQKLHFRQFFKVLELLGFGWAKDCKHVAHGLYLDSDGKKFSTRRGKTVYMAEVLQETIDLAKDEILKREKPRPKDIESRARAIALAAIKYGDLKNYREGDVIFDIEKFLSFEGDTGPYLVYSYVRAKNILKKYGKAVSKSNIAELSDSEKNLIFKMGQFPQVVKSAHEASAPNLVANYAFQLSQMFNEFYQKHQVVGSGMEKQRIAIVASFVIVLKNALDLLNIPTIERM